MAAHTSSLKNCRHKYKILQTTCGQNNTFILYKFWDFHSNIAEISILLGHDTESVVNHILNFWGKIVFSPSRVDTSKKIFPAWTIRMCCLKTLGSDYPHMYCHIPGEWNPQLQAYTKFRQHTHMKITPTKSTMQSLHEQCHKNTSWLIFTYTYITCTE